MDVSILVPENTPMKAIADPQYLFTALNDFLRMTGKKTLFKVQLVGLKNEMKINEGLYTISISKLLKDVKKTDLLIIPALYGDMKNALASNKEITPWIQEQYNKGAAVASLCAGAFLLASTGLIDGKKCATHWAYQNELKELFPEVHVVDDGVIIEEGRIYSSGGANSYWNLLIYLAEKFTDRQTAILASKYFAIDIDRESQSLFTIFMGKKNHHDNLIKQAQQYIENNTNKKITIEELSKMVFLGRRSFERRFKIATGYSVLEYINRVKIETAKESLELNVRNINEVMDDLGYRDIKTFRTIFKKFTGFTPWEYQNKYNKLPSL
ncbi:DJ-1/PfpI family protein [Flavobacterium sp.]|uniref:GlxA family transcriptional regulator n=1 Tax=Flavobacterium sp. TaxID=239 RepID=UPI00261C3C5A|nr:DJ-1/PfpI family protein [Flavobacterium sp.]